MKRLSSGSSVGPGPCGPRGASHSLSDHMLRDIGLRREEIPSALLERVVLAEPRLAQARAGGLVAEADRRREVPAA